MDPHAGVLKLESHAGVLELESQWNALKICDKARNGLVERMFAMCNEADEKIKSLECRIDKYHFHETAYETERMARIQENKGLEVQIKALTERLNAAPFVMVLVDGDNTLFLDQFVQAGTDGGHQAAQLLNGSLRDHLKESVGLQPHWKVVVRIFVKMYGLVGAYKRARIVTDHGTAREFFVGFNRELPFCDYVDVGYDKEGADNKIRENLTTFLENEGCKHVILAGSADKGFVTHLRQYSAQLLEKLTLVESVPFPADFRDFAARVKTKRFPELFREEKLDTELHANVQETPRSFDTPETMADNDEIQYEEVEVTDDEEESVEDTQEAASTPVSEAAPPPVTPRAKHQATPGKVNPAQKVKDLEMKSPETAAKTRKVALDPSKNPFPSFGAWSDETLSEIDIQFPVLTGKNESTNELTRVNRPEVRYWKAPITFKYNNFTSTTIRFNGVHIPFHTGKGYGSGFIYICLPGFAGERFAQAGKTRAPTRIHERSLVPETQRWWKTANNVEGTFGVINKTTKKFHSKSLETIFDSTQTGISATVVLKFTCKASTDEMEPLKPTTARTIAVEVVRGFIQETDINVQMPTKVSKVVVKQEPVATSGDVATDSLMKRLGELGL